MTEIATDPVSALLGIGKMRLSLASEWTDYRAEFGLTEDHVPALVRMAVDPQLNGAGADSQELWAPLHAWRALGQLRAVPAIDPLLRYFGRIEEDDYLDSDFPFVFGMIGYKALQPLIAFVGARRADTFKCAAATDAIKEIASCHPEHRDECIAALTTILDSRRRFDPELNGFIVANLLNLKAVEAIGAIRAAFERDAVEPSVAGDLEDIEIKLGFRETRSTPAPRFPLFSRWEESEPPLPKFVKTGRNDACPCGSGKKYKKCCMV